MLIQNEGSDMTRVIATTLFSLLAFLALGVALVSARYLLPEVPGAAPLMLPQIANWPLAVQIHVGCGVTALALGFFQLVTRRGPRRIWHRWAGRVYVVVCLVGAVAGLWLALHTTMGPVAAAGFSGLAVAWFTTTAIGWRKVVGGDFAQHRRWMIRSLSVTFAAVSLRILIPLSPLTGLSFEEAYPLISFLCWVPNLLLVEAWLRLFGWDARPQPSPYST